MIKAVILAGGKGTRLRPKTERIPKPMIEIAGRPLIEYVIKLLKYYGIENFILCVGYKKRCIKEFVGDGRNFGVNVEYAEEDENNPLGTGGAIYNARKLIDTPYYLICNADIITNFNVGRMIKLAKEYDSNFQSLVRPKNPYGVAKIRDINEEVAEIVDFKEKPLMREWINAGFNLLKRKTLELFKPKCSLEEDVLPILARNGELKGYKIRKGIWFAIDTEKDFAEVNKMKNLLNRLYYLN